MSVFCIDVFDVRDFNHYDTKVLWKVIMLAISFDNGIAALAVGDSCDRVGVNREVELNVFLLELRKEKEVEKDEDERRAEGYPEHDEKQSYSVVR